MNSSCTTPEHRPNDVRRISRSRADRPTTGQRTRIATRQKMNGSGGRRAGRQPIERRRTAGCVGQRIDAVFGRQEDSRGSAIRRAARNERIEWQMTQWWGWRSAPAAGVQRAERPATRPPARRAGRRLPRAERRAATARPAAEAPPATATPDDDGGESRTPESEGSRTRVRGQGPGARVAGDAGS